MFLARLEQRIMKPDAVARHNGTIISTDFMVICKRKSLTPWVHNGNVIDAAWHAICSPCCVAL